MKWRFWGYFNGLFQFIQMYCSSSQVRLHLCGTILCPDKYSPFQMSSFLRIMSCVGKSLLTRVTRLLVSRLDWVLLCETSCVPCRHLTCSDIKIQLGQAESENVNLQKMSMFLYLLGIENSLAFLGFRSQNSRISFVFVLKNIIATLCFTKTLNKRTFVE